MCLFCASIPVTLAVGVNLQRRRLEEQRQSGEAENQPPTLPVSPLTAVAVAGLVLSSVIYHSSLNSG